MINIKNLYLNHITYLLPTKLHLSHLKKFYFLYSLDFQILCLLLYSLHNGLALLHKYTSMELRGVEQTHVTQPRVIPLA